MPPKRRFCFAEKECFNTNKSMPATSKRQQRFMAICAHNPGKARGKCPSKKVAKEFSHKPKGGFRMPRKNRAGYY